MYRTRANKGRGLYTKNIFWTMIAANNQERLLIKNYFSANNVPTQLLEFPQGRLKKITGS